MKKRKTYCKALFLGLMFCLVQGAGMFAQPFQRVTNLPHLYINTDDGNGIYSKTEYTQGTLVRVTTDDVVETYDSVNFRGRGNSTWNMAKKPYRMKFAHKEKFLGKGFAKAKSWTLIANHADKTMMRNALTSALGDWLGLKNSPAHEYVDLTLNGSYRGTYMVSDHVEVRPHRVNVAEQDFPLADTSDISGGYLFEFDGFHDGLGFYTSRGGYVRIHYPDEEEIEKSQVQYATDYLLDVERRLFSSTFTDPEHGYRAVMDTTSLVNWYLATEICANIDGFWSTYCYKDSADARLYWGPLWDYDIAYGNDTRKGDTSQRLMRTDAYDGSRSWIVRMWDDPWFRHAVARRYAEARADGLDEFMLAQVDSLDALLQASQAMNYERWGINQRAYNERVLYSTYEEYVRDLRQFITTHNAWLATQFVLPTEPTDPEPPIDPETPVTPEPPFEPVVPAYPQGELASQTFCRFLNAGTGTAFDYDENLVCAWQPDASRLTQLWALYRLSDGLYQIYNASNGLALRDPGEGMSGQLQLGDDADDLSRWHLVPQGEYVNLINASSELCANLSGGYSSNGTRIIVYTSDERNATSSNRRWRIERTDVDVPPVLTSLSSSLTPCPDYALAYNATTQTLHFGSDEPLPFTARVYASDGREVGAFPATQSFSLSHLPAGTYFVTWQYAGRPHSRKFMKK